jgi:hypothetical protein
MQKVFGIKIKVIYFRFSINKIKQNNMTTANYNCNTQELYSAARLGWDSCSEQLTDFTAFKAKYTATYITAQLAEIDTAANLPDDQARAAKAESERINLTQIADTCLANWQKLKRYIADAFSTEQQKPNIESAGSQYYEKAGNYNWDSLQGLLTAGQTYIAANLAALQANQNMPAVFATTFGTDKTAFDNLHQQFLQSEELSQQGTEAKVIANNKVYSNLISMFLDGQEIYKTNEVIKKQFVFDQVLNLVSGTGTAGIKGYVTADKTNTPIQGAIVAIEQNGKSATTDQDGKYQILQVGANTYNIKIGAEGYTSKLIENVVIKTGTISTLSATLVPIS